MYQLRCEASDDTAPTIVSIYNFTFHSAVFNSHQGPLGVFGWVLKFSS